MKLYALLDYETLVKKEWSIERFISTCKALHVEIIQYRDKKGDRKRKIENLNTLSEFKNLTALSIVADSIENIDFLNSIRKKTQDFSDSSLA